MKFVMVRDYSHDLSKDKVIIGKVRKTYMEGFESVTLAYLKKIGDFDENDKYILVRNTESVQIRPKAIYRNSKGYYILEDNKRVYLDNIKQIEKAIQDFSLHLSLMNAKRGE